VGGALAALDAGRLGQQMSPAGAMRVWMPRSRKDSAQTFCTSWQTWTQRPHLMHLVKSMMIEPFERSAWARRGRAREAVVADAELGGQGLQLAAVVAPAGEAGVGWLERISSSTVRRILGQLGVVGGDLHPVLEGGGAGARHPA
jgi:hypothetical protein